MSKRSTAIHSVRVFTRHAHAFVTGPFNEATQHAAGTVLLWLLPVALYAAAMLLFNVNMPEGDDIHGLAEFLLRYHDAAGPAAKLGTVLAPHNVHLILFQHLAAVLNLEIANAVNFNTLKWVGSFGLFAAAALVWQAAGKMDRKAYLLIPLPLLLLCARPWVNMVSALCALTWNWNLLLGFAALTMLVWALRRNETDCPALRHIGLGTGVLLGLLCALSLMGGIGALLAGGAYLALRRRWAWSAVWFAIFVAALAAFGTISHNGPSLFDRILWAAANPVDMALFYLSLCGSLLRIGAQPVTSIAFGAVLVIGAVRLIIFGAPKADAERRPAPALRLFAVHLLLLCAAIAVGRADMGLEQAFRSRYAILSAMLACVVYATYAPRLAKSPRHILPYVLLAALALNLGSHVDALGKFRTRKQGMIRAQTMLHEALSDPDAPLPTGLDPAVVALAQKGLFKP